jgi:hypothetical protein
MFTSFATAPSAGGHDPRQNLRELLGNLTAPISIAVAHLLLRAHICSYVRPIATNTSSPRAAPRQITIASVAAETFSFIIRMTSL